MIENQRKNELDNINISGFPEGYAILSYSNIYNAEIDTLTQGYVILKNVVSPLLAQKGQRVGEIPIIGRNTDVMQSMGGEGLIYPELQFMLHDTDTYDIVDEVAFQTVTKLAGWCDAGTPLYFAYEKMIRRVLIFKFEFSENRSRHWYDCKMVLKKYVPIDPLAYQRTIVDLAPYPELPYPVDTTPVTGSGEQDVLNPGTGSDSSSEWTTYRWTDSATGDYGSISAKNKSDGTVNCIPHTLTEEDLVGTIEDFVVKMYGPLTRSKAGSIGYLIAKLAQERWGIDFDLFGLFTGKKSLGDIPMAKRTICIPRTVKIMKNGSEEIVNAKT